MKIGLYYRIRIHDEEGKLVREILRPSHSYVIQFLEAIEGLLDRRDKEATEFTGNEEYIVEVTQAAQYFVRVDAVANDDNYGVLVGTNAGATAEGNENYNLDTKIADGSGAGQLLHGICTVSTPVGVGAYPYTRIDLYVSRIFENQSGGGVTIREIGLMCKNSWDTFYHLLLRDVVPDEIVPVGYSFTVSYRLQTQSPG